MKYEIVIVADTNDAKNITAINEINMETIQKFQPVINAIKACSVQHNWPAHEYMDYSIENLYPDLDPDLLDFFEEFLPYSEDGIHTIKSVEYYPLPIKTKLI